MTRRCRRQPTPACCASATRTATGWTPRAAFSWWWMAWVAMRRASWRPRPRWRPFANRIAEAGGRPEERVRRAIAARQQPHLRRWPKRTRNLARHGVRAHAGAGGGRRAHHRPRGRFAPLPDLERRHPQAHQRPFAGGRGRGCGRADRERKPCAHPRRHEVFRDVGSRRACRGRGVHRDPPMPLPPGRRHAAVQRRPDRPSDGSAEVREIVERYDGDAAARGARAGGSGQSRRAGATTSPRCSWPGRNSSGRAGITRPRSRASPRAPRAALPAASPAGWLF